MEIYILRHTKVAVGEGVCYGHSDVPLADTFEDEAKVLEKKLQANFDAVYSSPSQRCIKLATVIADTDYIIDHRLLEMDFGNWENNRWEDLSKEALDLWMKDFVHIRTENGESLEDLQKRVISFLDELLKSSYQKVLIITHSGVIRCIGAYILEIPLKNIFKFPVTFGSVYCAQLSQDKNLNMIKSII